VLVPPGDEEALAQAIIRLLQDTTLRNTLAQAGQKRAKEFDVPQIFRKYRRLIVNGTARVKLYQQTWNRENPSFSSSLH
jgi:glycosyltransferase involved in cell wall biosynthesis